MSEGTIEAVRTFRRAAREIVRGPGTREAKGLALLRLAAEGLRHSSWQTLLAPAVWAETEAWFAGEDQPAPPPAADPAEGACRALRAQGRTRCPDCRRPLPSDGELDRWRGLRERAVEEMRAREGAVL